MKRWLYTFALTLVLCLGMSITASASDTGEVGKPNVMTNSMDLSAVVDENGVLWMWGRVERKGDIGQLIAYISGNGTENVDADVNHPFRVMDHVVSISQIQGGTGVYPSMFALKDDGTLWAWGCNTMGQLGNGGVYDYDAAGRLIQTTPMKIMDDVAAIASGTECAAAIKTDGSLWMWGRNDDCQLGIGPGGNTQGTRGVGGSGLSVTYDVWNTPQKVMDHVKAVSLGSNHTAAVKTDGSLWVWGENMDGALGNGGTGDLYIGTETIPHQSVPLKIMDDVATVSCHGNTTAALKTDGTLWMWGDNWDGGVGNGYQGDDWYTSVNVDGSRYSLPSQTTPVMVLDDVVDVFVGGDTAAIRKDGTLWMWGGGVGKILGPDIVGNDTYGRQGKLTIQTVPAKVMDDDDIIDFFYLRYPMIVRPDGSLWAWSYDDPYASEDVHPANPEVPASNIPMQIPNLKVRIPGTTNTQTTQPEQTQTTTFSDVSNSHWAYPYVMKAAEEGWVSGIGNGLFGVDDQVTYAEFTTMLVRAYYEDDLNAYTGPADQWYTSFCNVANDHNLYWNTNAYRDDYLSYVVNPLNRYDMAQMLFTVLESYSILTSNDQALKDSIADWDSIPEYYQPAVVGVVSVGLISGVDDNGTFNGDGVMTRAQAATVMCRLAELIGD